MWCATPAPGTSITWNDLRIKMCIDITEEDLHHHPPRAGPQFLPARLQQAAVPVPRQRQRRFPRSHRRHHRAVGDAGVSGEARVCCQKAPDASKDIGLLLNKALEKIAFLPFGLMIDQWRWQVFSGEIPPDKYNQAWWDLRLKYQGIAPPDARERDGFSIRARSITCRRMFRTRATSWPIFCSSSFIARWRSSRLPAPGQRHAAESLLDLRQQGSRARS